MDQIVQFFQGLSAPLYPDHAHFAVSAQYQRQLGIEGLQFMELLILCMFALAPWVMALIAITSRPSKRK